MELASVPQSRLFVELVMLLSVRNPGDGLLQNMANQQVRN